MVTPEVVQNEIWPVVPKLIEAALAEDTQTLCEWIVPGQQAAEALELFGFIAFDLLLKSVLGRDHLGLIRAVETENGRCVHIEYAWPEAEAKEGSYTAVDLVSVKLTQVQGQWRVVEINPAGIDLPLSGARARGILAAGHVSSDGDDPLLVRMLPIAFYGGMMTLPLQKAAMVDVVEKLLLPGLQQRTYGLAALIQGRRLWRDFKKAADPTIDKPARWAAAVEYIMSQQDMRDLTQAAVAKHYKLGLAAVAPRVKQIKRVLEIEGLDDRYTDLQPTQIVYENTEKH